MEKYVTNPVHPVGDNQELETRIHSMLLTPFDVTRGLWEAQLSSGALGTSGAIASEQFKQKTAQIERETLLLFRAHHSLCDGVSLSIVVGEIADESDKLKEQLQNEIRKRKQKKELNSFYFIITLYISCKIMLWYIFSSIFASIFQIWRVATASSPFDEIVQSSKLPATSRSIAWRDLDSVNTIKMTAKRMSPSATVNDLAVHLVMYAIRRQLNEHNQKSSSFRKIPEKVNIVIPVHLSGGIIPEGEDIGNKIGAFVATVPLPSVTESSCNDLKTISRILKHEKSSPAPMISWVLAKLCSEYMPINWTKYNMRKLNAKAVAVISNVKGWPFQVHWLGRKVCRLCAFLPLPPGIPIGAVIQSYDGNISFSINADSRAVPDANIFADWMVEEYARMK